jgi:hypothetical protein
MMLCLLWVNYHLYMLYMGLADNMGRLNQLYINFVIIFILRGIYPSHPQSKTHPFVVSVFVLMV